MSSVARYVRQLYGSLSCAATGSSHTLGHKPTVANGRFATVQHDCARPANEAIGLRTPPPPTIDYDMALFARGGGLLGYGPDGADR
jgi:hypothetical protein